ASWRSASRRTGRSQRRWRGGRSAVSRRSPCSDLSARSRGQPLQYTPPPAAGGSQRRQPTRQTATIGPPKRASASRERQRPESKRLPTLPPVAYALDSPSVRFELLTVNSPVRTSDFYGL